MSTVELQSQDHRDLLDIIDRLRLLGVTRYIDLPQIVVCGDQSAGKSSVLEAISGLSFPTKDNLCTRFPTELVLRRDKTPGVQVSIIPGPDRGQQEIADLSKFHYEVDLARPDLSGVIEQAKVAMSLSESKVFSNDILRVELKGPNQPHLTLVDLPGLFRAGSESQSVEGAPLVYEMVRSYMEKPRSIILAVVSAQSDFNLQPITELSRKLDPHGIRTLGLITKPDTLPEGSDSEASYIKLAQNRDVVFRLGWHCLRNRSYGTRNVSSTERDTTERQFFTREPWTHLDSSTVGIQALRPRLSDVLKNLIIQQLPSLVQDVSAGISDCQQRRQRLGEPRGTIAEQRNYLRQVSWNFSLLMRASVDGFYVNGFFGDADTWTGYQRRLRAVVQNQLESFAEAMRLRGRALIIEGDDDNDDDVERASDSSLVRQMTRDAYLQHVVKLMCRSRGCELPGTFNPMIVSALFREQCQPWKGIATRTQEEIIQASRKAMRMILDSVAVPEIVGALSRRIDQTIDGLATEVKTQTEQMLKPHLFGHPITYNHYLTDTVQKVQNERSRKYGVQVDMRMYASQLATDYMQAYYKVAMKRFVDDVGVFSIEERLMQQLPQLFDGAAVDKLTDQEIASLAAESEATVLDRQHNTEKLAALETAMYELQRLRRHHTTMFDEPLEYTNEFTGKSQQSESLDLEEHSPGTPTAQVSETGDSAVGEEYVVPDPVPMKVSVVPAPVPMEVGISEAFDSWGNLPALKKKKKTKKQGSSWSQLDLPNCS